MAELLAQGADLRITDKQGNCALHYASINEQKGAIEILLRSGADPTIPNETGTLPVELSESPMVKDLFIREPTHIFSPMVQARALFHDYVQQLHEADQQTLQMENQKHFFPALAEQSEGAVSTEDTASSSVSPEHLLATNLNSEFEKSDQPLTDDSLPLSVDHSKASDASSQPVIAANSPINNTAANEVTPSSAPASPRKVEEVAVIVTTPTHTAASPPLLEPHQQQSDLQEYSRLPPSILQTLTAGRAAASSVPPTTPLSSYNVLPMMTPSTALAAESLGAILTPWELEELQDKREIQQAVLKAAQETAALVLLNVDEKQIRFDLVRMCQRLPNDRELRRLLAYDPTLPMCRLSTLGVICVDGQTPIHVAAKFGNVKTLRVFQELGQNVTFWVRDLQGRTPLHLAAMSKAEGTLQTIEFLRKEMYKERNYDPIGCKAPVDLAGMTPLGHAKIEVKGKVSAPIESALFSPGDKSILPLTPHEKRTGKSPWKAPLSMYAQNSRENVIYAMSEAQGWTPAMEDRHAISCPVPGRPSWGLFCVFDGHGGSYSSNFLSITFPDIIAKLAADLDKEMGSSYLPGGTANDSDVTPEVLDDLLVQACIFADDLLAQQPRMKVEPKSNSDKRLICLDRSGSTGIITLITSKYIATANVGDSRGVMGLKGSAAPKAADLMASPFAAAILAKEKENEKEVEDVIAEGDDVTASLENLSLSRTRSNSGPRSPSKGGKKSIGTSILTVVELSRDHKASIPEEKQRVEKAGAEVRVISSGDDSNAEVSEIFTPLFEEVKLRMTRSFGDFYLKHNTSLSVADQAIIAVPEVRVITRSAADAFVILACDGVWDVMTNQEAVDFIADNLGFTAYGGPVGGVSTAMAAKACDDLLAFVLSRGSTDNLTVILIIPGAPPAVSATQLGSPEHSFYRLHSVRSVNSSDESFSGKAVPHNFGSPTPFNSFASLPMTNYTPSSNIPPSNRKPSSILTSALRNNAAASSLSSKMEIDLPSLSTHPSSQSGGKIRFPSVLSMERTSTDEDITTPQRATRLPIEDDESTSPINSALGTSRTQRRLQFLDA
eukprot:scaffold4233_cov180-Ochromonas_danica.AAC.14